MTQETVDSRVLDVLCDLVASDVSQRSYPDDVRRFIFDRKRDELDEMKKRHASAATFESVGLNSALEELCLRRLDQLFGENDSAMKAHERNHLPSKDFRPVNDPRALSLARTHLQEAFAWLQRAVVNPDRIDGSSTTLLEIVTSGLAKDDPSIETFDDSKAKDEKFYREVAALIGQRFDLTEDVTFSRLKISLDDKLPAYVVTYLHMVDSDNGRTYGVKVPKGASAIQAFIAIREAMGL